MFYSGKKHGVSFVTGSRKSGSSTRENAVYFLGDDVLVENQLDLGIMECFPSRLSFTDRKGRIETGGVI